MGAVQFTMGRKWRDRFFDKLIQSIVGSCYCPSSLGRFHVTAQSRISYLNWDQDSVHQFELKNSRFTCALYIDLMSSVWFKSTCTSRNMSFLEIKLIFMYSLSIEHIHTIFWVVSCGCMCMCLFVCYSLYSICCILLTAVLIFT